MESLEKYIEENIEEINALKSEYLKEGIKPIMTCHFNFEEDKEEQYFNNEETFIKKNALWVDYFDIEDDLNSKNISNAGERTYVISPNDERDKFSHGYKNCTGVVLVGRDKKSGKEISFMSHQDPISFLFGETKEKFINDIKEKISELKNNSEDKTIDAVIFGGNDRLKFKEYISSIELLNEIIKSELGFSPVVITGPNVIGASEQVFFDTQNRRLYILKPESKRKPTNQSYLASDIQQKKKDWE